MTAPNIADGYTRDDQIQATKRHGAISITYRPMTRGERNRLAMQVSRLIDQKKEEDASRVTASTLSAKLVSWESADWQRVFIRQFKTDVNSAGPAITTENFEIIEPNLFEKIYRAMAGYDDEENEAEVAKREGDEAGN